MDPKTPTVQPPSPALIKNKPLPPIPVPPTPEPPSQPPAISSSVVTGSTSLTGPPSEESRGGVTSGNINNVPKRRKDRLTLLGTERVSEFIS